MRCASHIPRKGRSITARVLPHLTPHSGHRRIHVRVQWNELVEADYPERLFYVRYEAADVELALFGSERPRYLKHGSQPGRADVYNSSRVHDHVIFAGVYGQESLSVEVVCS